MSRLDQDKSLDQYYRMVWNEYIANEVRCDKYLKCPKEMNTKIWRMKKKRGKNKKKYIK